MSTGMRIDSAVRGGSPDTGRAKNLTAEGNAANNPTAKCWNSGCSLLKEGMTHIIPFDQRVKPIDNGERQYARSVMLGE
jgi:hypothetical protein